jgi:hypothetical protein
MLAHKKYESRDASSMSLTCALGSLRFETGNLETRGSPAAPAECLLERIAFTLCERDKSQLRRDLRLRDRPPIRALQQTGQNRPRASRRGFRADEDSLIARGARLARIEGPDDVQIIDEEAAPHIRVDVLEWVVEVRQFRVRRTDEA